jgi:hypothetical protein
LLGFYLTLCSRLLLEFVRLVGLLGLHLSRSQVAIAPAGLGGVHLGGISFPALEVPLNLLREAGIAHLGCAVALDLAHLLIGELVSDRVLLWSLVWHCFCRCPGVC